MDVTIDGKITADVLEHVVRSVRSRYGDEISIRAAKPALGPLVIAESLAGAALIVAVIGVLRQWRRDRSDKRRASKWTKERFLKSAEDELAGQGVLAPKFVDVRDFERFGKAGEVATVIARDEEKDETYKVYVSRDGETCSLILR